MPHVLNTPRTDVKAHDQAWATATMVLAAVSLVLALAERYDAGALAGAAGVLAGGWSMLVSRTIAERFETATGTVLGGVVLAVCLAYGSGLSV